MLSICIPVYNYNVTTLVARIYEQVLTEKIEFEIILIDDCSESNYREMNNSLCGVSEYVQLEENIGRARIRNLFLEYSSHKYLLFLDCDSEVISPDFIGRYVKSLSGNHDGVICGGRNYSDLKPNRSKMLRWSYGRAYESKSVQVRTQMPNHSFMTNNYAISREVFETVLFDERLVLYGHEDTVYGLQLKQKNILVKHIDNPIMDGDIEVNSVYLNKTEDGVQNLVQIFKDYELNFVKDIRLINAYLKLKRNHIILPVRLFYLVFGGAIKYFLKKGYVNLTLFSLYKLGLFVSFKRR